MRAAAAVVAMVAVLAAVIFGGYELGWWFRADSTQRQGQVTRSSYGFQQAHRDELTSEISQVYTITTQITGASGEQAAALRAQRRAVLSQSCRTASQITDPLPGEQAAFVAQNCSAGTASPSSSYAS